MSLKAETKDQQSRLARYTRDGHEPELIGTTEGRTAHYRRLVMGVIREAMTSTYPLTVNLLTQKEWSVLYQEFFEEHDCQHPQVWRMPQELIQYTKEHQSELTRKYPHIIDLLRLEWLEAEYYMMPDRTWDTAITEDFWMTPWNLNPESQLLDLDYPVHLKNARFISLTDKGEFHCLIYRQSDTGKVKFINLSPFLNWLLNEMKVNPNVSLFELAPSISEHFGLTDIEALKVQLEKFFNKMKEEGMVR